MDVRCGSYNSLLFFSIAVILIFCSQLVCAQCKADFTYQSVPSEKNDRSGQIDVLITNPATGNYTFKLFEMNGTMKMVDTKEVSSPERITFEGLKSATYFIRIEWGESCSQALGGFEGIIVTEKEQRR